MSLLQNVTPSGESGILDRMSVCTPDRPVAKSHVMNEQDLGAISKSEYITHLESNRPGLRRRSSVRP